jgi:hypothetical protein
MKRVLILCVVAALPAAAQWHHFGEDRFRLTGYFGGGFSEPINPAARNLDTGWNVSGGVGATNKWFGILFDAMFNDFGFNHSTLVQVGAPHGSQKFWAVTVDPVFHVNERGPVDFYVTAGGGLYSRITEFRGYGYGGPYYGGRGDLLFSDTIYTGGVNGGAGFSFNLGYHPSPVKLFVEARFHHMFTYGSGASFVPVTVGVRF